MIFEEIILIDDNLRLRKPQKSEWEKALPWYSDREVMQMSEGISEGVYKIEDINRMYEYLNKIGQLYFIEILERNLEWKAIGDATFSESSLPIVIGEESYRGKGIGKGIISKFIEIAREKGLKELRVKEVYHENMRSQSLFKGLGFEELEKHERGSSYKLKL